MLAVGAAGAVGCAFTVTFVGVETQVLSEALLVLNACEPEAIAAKVADDWNVPPSTLYSNPAPNGAVIVTVPVATAHVG